MTSLAWMLTGLVISLITTIEIWIMYLVIRRQLRQVAYAVAGGLSASYTTSGSDRAYSEYRTSSIASTNGAKDSAGSR